jgi:RNA polymerase sigma factor (sigma-70 family)
VTDLSTPPLSTPERARVHATAWAILGDSHAADDVAQELSLHMQDLPGIGDPRVRGSWVARKALGMSLNRRRGERRRWAHEREAGAARARLEVELPTCPLEREEDVLAVRQALGALEERERLPLILRYFHDRRLSEIASILDIPLSTAHERLQRGLGQLRGRLRRLEVTPALVSLALPRASVVLLPAAAVGRTAILASGGWGLMRAAALVATIGLAPLIPRVVSITGGSELEVARVPEASMPQVFVTPPSDDGTSAGDLGRGLGRNGASPPGFIPPPRREGRRESEGGTTPETRTKDSKPVGGGFVPQTQDQAEGGPAARGWLPGSGPVPVRADSATGDDSVDWEQSQSEAQGPGGGQPPEQSESDASDGPGSGPGDGPGSGSPGNGGPGSGNDDPPVAGAQVWGSGAPWPGQVLAAASGEPLAGVWVLLKAASVDDESADESAVDDPPVAAAATDDQGRFELPWPGGSGAWKLVVGVPNQAGGFDELPLQGRPDWEFGVALTLELDL